MKDVVAAIQAELHEQADPAKPDFLANRFKNRPGYLPDDYFLGVSVPKQRTIAGKYFRTISLHNTEKLLQGRWHEERFTALLILIKRYQAFDFNRQDIFEIYMNNLSYINNWDLVDTSAPIIVGDHLKESPYKMKVLRKIATADRVWERRIAILACYRYIKAGSADEAMEIAELLLHDPDEYLHKAVGWMLREVGNRIDNQLLTEYLDQHADSMPRTMLRYAIEKLSVESRLQYMKRS